MKKKKTLPAEVTTNVLACLFAGFSVFLLYSRRALERVRCIA